jgi:hypothetical protein
MQPPLELPFSPWHSPENPQNNLLAIVLRRGTALAAEEANRLLIKILQTPQSGGLRQANSVGYVEISLRRNRS